MLEYAAPGSALLEQQLAEGPELADAGLEDAKEDAASAGVASDALLPAESHPSAAVLPAAGQPPIVAESLFVSASAVETVPDAPEDVMTAAVTAVDTVAVAEPATDADVHPGDAALIGMLAPETTADLPATNRDTTEMLADGSDPVTSAISAVEAATVAGAVQEIAELPSTAAAAVADVLEATMEEMTADETERLAATPAEVQFADMMQAAGQLEPQDPAAAQPGSAAVAAAQDGEVLRVGSKRPKWDAPAPASAGAAETINSSFFFLCTTAARVLRKVGTRCVEPSCAQMRLHRTPAWRFGLAAAESCYLSSAWQ